MKLTHATSLLLLLSAFGTCAQAQVGTTRGQVKSELAAAIRSGDMIVSGESGLTLRELYPQRYPTAPAFPGKTREQVTLELADAIRTGDIVAAGELELKRNEVNPRLYPTRFAAAGKTRAQVKDELAQAIRSGDMVAAGEGVLRLNEQYPQRYAKARLATIDAPQHAASAAASSVGRALAN